MNSKVLAANKNEKPDKAYIQFLIYGYYVFVTYYIRLFLLSPV